MSFFTNGGAEANENAIKLARWYTGRHKIVARYRSYHGATAGAITLTGDPRRWAAEPGIPGVVRMLDPYTYRCPAGHPDPCPVCTGAPHLEEILQYEGPETVAAVILETVVGHERRHRRRRTATCSRSARSATGTGSCSSSTRSWPASAAPAAGSRARTGTSSRTSSRVAKGINSGYVPLGAMVVREPIADWVADKYFAGGLTYSGHPLACAAGVASIEAFREEGIVEHAAEMGDVLRERAARARRAAPVRSATCAASAASGASSSCGTARRASRSSRSTRPARRPRPIMRVAKAALERGLYLMVHWNVVMVCPPLTITREELDEGLAVLDEALAVADEYAA